MARGNIARPLRRVEAEYAINWRVAGTIAVLGLLIAIIPLSRQLWLPYLGHDSAAKSQEPLTKSAMIRAAESQDASSTELRDDKLSLEPFTPWIPRESEVPVVQRSVQHVHYHVKKTEQSETTETDYAANNETSPPPASSPRAQKSDDDLLKELLDNSVEISIDDMQSMREEILRAARVDSSGVALEGRLPGEGRFFQLVGERSDLEGLPFRRDDSCRKPESSLETLKDISKSVRELARQMRRRSGGSGGGLENFEADMEIEGSFVSALVGKETWHRPEAVMTLVQVVQNRGYPIRLSLVELLARIPGEEAAAALVDRALFDISPYVRQAANNALRNRSLSSAVRQRLIQGLRYPLPLVSENAVDSIVKLKMRESLQDLEDLVNEPDPVAPFLDQYGQWRKTELVRMNHFRNCMLCHPVSTSRRDNVRGAIPTPGEPLPPEYYESREGNFVRADSTYLQQDFSVFHRMRQDDPWGEYQRYDYFVRTRSLTPEERAKVEQGETVSPPSRNYPQRDAVRRAILELQALP